MGCRSEGFCLTPGQELEPNLQTQEARRWYMVSSSCRHTRAELQVSQTSSLKKINSLASFEKQLPQ
uniref:Uncharacterized protein n=1 Tax=Arundo donax TaxID=35708 RepID=A0A0A9F6E0_ARUDO